MIDMIYLAVYFWVISPALVASSFRMIISCSIFHVWKQTREIKEVFPWWRHQTETFSALLAICPGNSPVTGEFPAQRPVTQSVGVFFDLRLNKRLSKQPWGWWFETLSPHYDVTVIIFITSYSYMQCSHKCGRARTALVRFMRRALSPFVWYRQNISSLILRHID